ncbi:C39 family peptidase [Radiobacillus kanasensis]|uniref:C39 family peptidase n=1 Tax=Radiobacillus kanasensis TaxID=2844358 RepID=UPI001E6307AA|nr:C39 family peptidase [Radiobacillus kanasensis]UFT98861.1 C39 family peptidase [Radiobacillus kanasensis]
MKKRKIAFIVLISLILTACGQSVAVEETKEKEKFKESKEEIKTEASSKTVEHIQEVDLERRAEQKLELLTTSKKVPLASTAALEEKQKEGAPTTDYSTTEHEQTYEITVAEANLRKGPSTKHEKVFSLFYDTKVEASQKANLGDSDWYYISAKGKEGWISSSIVEEFEPTKQSELKVIVDAPLINQMPLLPRGCEVTSLAMLLQFAGVSVDKMTLAEEVIRVPFEENGLRGNPYNGFVGNMYTFDEPGLGVYHGPIAELGKKYLSSIVDLTGQSFDAVINQLNAGKPVWVINNTTFSHLSNGYWETWNTSNGEIQITYKEHSVLVTGYDDQYIYFNDPLAMIKNRKVSREDFIAGWEQIGSQAISYN